MLKYFVTFFLVYSCVSLEDQSKTIKSKRSRFQKIGMPVQTNLVKERFSIKSSEVMTPISNEIVYMEYMAKLLPPSGQNIQATTAYPVGANQLIITYNTAGEQVGGAVDLVDLNGDLQILDTVYISNMEFSTVLQVDDYILLGGQCFIEEEARTSACLTVSNIVNGQINILKTINLSSYYITGLAHFGDELFVTTGATGDFYRFAISRKSSITLFMAKIIFLLWNMILQTIRLLKILP